MDKIDDQCDDKNQFLDLEQDSQDDAEEDQNYNEVESNKSCRSWQDKPKTPLSVV